MTNHVLVSCFFFFVHGLERSVVYGVAKCCSVKQRVSKFHVYTYLVTHFYSPSKTPLLNSPAHSNPIFFFSFYLASRLGLRMS